MRRSEVLSRVQGGELKLHEGAQLIGVSYRQAKRLKKRYGEGGARALVHGNVGRRSNRAKPGSWRARVIERVREHYCGEGQERFGPTLAAEHLASEHGLAVDAETLRRWMLVEGLWSRRRRHKPQRRRRPRKAHFGEMLQLDGSHHEWLEGRGPKGCLMNLVDDATGRGLCRFSREETTWAAAGGGSPEGPKRSGGAARLDVPAAGVVPLRGLSPSRDTLSLMLTQTLAAVGGVVATLRPWDWPLPTDGGDAAFVERLPNARRRLRP